MVHQTGNRVSFTIRIAGATVGLYLKNAGEEPGLVRTWGICLLFRLKAWLVPKSTQKISSLLCNCSGKQKAWEPISFWSSYAAVKIDSRVNLFFLKPFPQLTGILDIQTIKLWAKQKRKKDKKNHKGRVFDPRPHEVVCGRWVCKPQLYCSAIVGAIRLSLTCYTKGLQHTKPGTHQFTDPKRVLWSLLLWWSGI